MRPPTRQEVNTRGRVLRKGDRRKADLLLIELEEGPVLVKDFSGKPWPRRLLGRLQLLREYRAYRRVGEIEGLPRLIGLVDAHALALEKVDGVQLGKSEKRFSGADAHLRRLRELLDRLHARGLVHLDLRGKGNVLLRPDGGLVIVDLAAALWFRPGGLLHRLFFRWFAMTDETALLKWKARLAYDRLTEEEKSLLERFRFLRLFWIFNRRHLRPRELRPGGSTGAPGSSSRSPVELSAASRPEDEVLRQ